MTTKRERELAAAGRAVGTCPVDGTVFDPHTSYQPGHQSNAPRGYCSTNCRREASNVRAAKRQAHRRKPNAFEKPHRLVLSPATQAHIEAIEEANPSPYNAYTCDACKRTFLTIDTDRGTTPVFLSCWATEGCPGQAVSAGYPPGPPPEALGEPVLVWFRPEWLTDLDEWERDHVTRGGLLHRPGPGAPDWVIEAH